MKNSANTRLLLLSSFLLGTNALQRQSVHRKPLSLSPKTWGILLSKDRNPTTDNFDLLDFHDDATVDATVSSSQDTTESSTRLTEQSKGPQIVLMGAPSSGKGTQSERIVQQYNVVHLSTGDMLREAVKRDAEHGIGAIAKAYMNRGELVPDEIMTQLVLDRISQPDCLEKGWILDGFPRTRGQAEAMKQLGITPDVFLFLHVADSQLIERVVGRRSDPLTGKIYHLKFFPPPTEEIRDRLVQRSDDTVEKMQNRLKAFHANVDSVREFYENVFVEVNGSGTPDGIAVNVFEAIDKRQVLVEQ